MLVGKEDGKKFPASCHTKKQEKHKISSKNVKITNNIFQQKDLCRGSLKGT